MIKLIETLFTLLMFGLLGFATYLFFLRPLFEGHM
jgi:hypothetical protein